MERVKRNILLNPGPATTTDTVKMAQIVPDICPREQAFARVILDIRKDLVRIVHGDLNKYKSVIFSGSGTICIDACISSLVDAGKKILIINNGFYSNRAADVCKFYHIDYIDLAFPIDDVPNLKKIENILKENKSISAVYTCHHETGTGLLNPIREIGALVHKYNCIHIVDTISTFALMPIDIEKDNVDFLMSSSQKGLMSTAGLSYVIGNVEMLEKSKDFVTRSYYTNLYMQYVFFEEKGEMQFTPPVQTVYALKQAIKEYWAEGEIAKWERHKRVWKAIHKGVSEVGFKNFIPTERQSQLVCAVKCPSDPHWNFQKIHDFCYEKGFTIYPGKISKIDTFRLCGLGAIDVIDIESFFQVFQDALKACDVTIPIQYH